MSKKVVAANLLDMIELITSRRLQEEVFALNAPGMDVKWGRLPKDCRKRAVRLYGRMEEFAKERNKFLRNQHSALFRALNTIALINADSANTAEIETKIRYKPALNAFLRDSFTTYDLPEGPRKTANLVAFVNVAMLRNQGTEVGDEAKAVWDDLLASAMAELDYIKHDSKKLRPPRKGFNRSKGLSDFEDELRRTVAKKFSEDEYLVVAVCNTVDEYVRYLVKTTPLDHDVSKVVRGKDGKRRFENMPDDNADAFEIRYYERHNRIEISRTRIIGTHEIAEMFARDVLGTTLDERKKRYYDKPLQIFRSEDCLKKIRLPEECEKSGDRLWVQSIRLAAVQAEEVEKSKAIPDGIRLTRREPTTYHGSEHHPIFGEIGAMLDPVRFPPEHRDILGSEVAMFLHDRKLVDGRPLACTNGKTYVIRISERHFIVVDKNKIHSRYLLDLFDRLQKDWGFEGLTPEERGLGRGRAKAEGAGEDGLFGDT